MTRGRTVAIVVFLFLVGRAAAGQTTLSPSEIQAAIDWGTSHADVAPYLLRHAQGDGTNAFVVAAVYTPFVRVALVSHRAWMEGHRLEPTDLPAEITDSRIDIAARWYAKAQGCAFEDQVNVVAAQKGAGLDALRPGGGIPPSAVRQPSWLRRFAPDPPYADVSVVVSYPLDLLREDLDFLVWKRGISDKGLPCVSVETGRIPSAERKDWR